MPTRSAVLLILACLASGCRSGTPPPPRASAAPGNPPAAAPPIKSVPPPPTPAAVASPVTKVEMHNVVVHEDDILKLRIRWLRAQILPGRPGVIPSFDDKSSMLFQIEAGVISVSADDITALLNRRVLAYPGSPLTAVTVSTQGQQLKIRGTLHKGVPVPIEVLADLSATPDGHIRVHPAKLRALHIPIKALLKGLGIHMGDLIDPKGAKGLTVQGDDLILNMEKMMPAPEKRGFITAVHISGNDLVETYGSPHAEVVRARQWKNFIAFQGGSIRFGKLTMHNADIVMIDTTSDTWFDFFLDHYQDQLRAGYITTTATQGLRIYMQDYSRLSANAVPKPALPKDNHPKDNQ